MAASPLKNRAPREAPSPSPDRNDGLSAIAFYSAWIVNADTKIGFLATGVTVIGAAEFGKLNHFVNSHPFSGVRSEVGGTLLIASLVGVTLAALSLVCALTPRTASPPMSTRYAFPDLIRHDFGYLPTLDAVAQREEAWVQARALAEIATKKLRYFKFGLYAFSGSAPLLGVSAVLIK